MTHKLDAVIYGLLDPFSGELRYIGKTKHGLKRIKAHLHPSKLRESNRKNNWIKSLLSKGAEPGLKIFCNFYNTEEDLSDLEISYISMAKGLGEELYNGTNGGDGGDTGGGAKRRRPIISKNLLSGEEKWYEFIHAAEKDGFNPSHIVAVCKGKRPHHKGFKFYYANVTENKV